MLFEDAKQLCVTCQQALRDQDLARRQLGENTPGLTFSESFAQLHHFIIDREQTRRLNKDNRANLEARIEALQQTCRLIEANKDRQVAQLIEVIESQTEDMHKSARALLLIKQTCAPDLDSFDYAKDLPAYLADMFSMDHQAEELDDLDPDEQVPFRLSLVVEMEGR
jgi:hypothetical protein